MNLTLFGRNSFMFAVVFSCIVLAGGLFLPVTHRQAGDMNVLTIATIILFLFVVPISLWKLMTGTKGEEFMLISGLSTIAGYGIVQFFSTTGDLSLAVGTMCVVALVLLFFVSRDIAQSKGHVKREIEHMKKIFWGQEMVIMGFQIIVAVIFLSITGGF